MNELLFNTNDFVFNSEFYLHHTLNDNNLCQKNYVAQ